MSIAPAAITAMLSDLIYEKFSVEEEDQLQVMKDPCKLLLINWYYLIELLTDAEIPYLIMQME